MASFPAMTDLLGPELVTKAGTAKTADALAGKDVVGLYFSAHWCPPCRNFTPLLGKFYEAKKAAGASFEIVFVSSDKDAKAFAEYYGEQASWTALPFGDRKKKEELSKKYKVRGIPTFVVVDGKTGETITLDGREGVSNEPEAFPWKPKSLDEVLEGLPPLQDKSGGEVLLEDKPGPLLLYFSAHWCPPCKRFTPELVKFFDTLKAKHADANCCFVSSDKDQGSFDGYFGEMGANWLALPYSARDAKTDLSKAFDVSGIPTLVLLSAADAAGKRTVVTTSGRECVSDGLVEGFPAAWAPKPFGDLTKTTESKGASVNDAKALCVFAHGLDGAAQDAAVAALKKVATADRKGETLYFFATSLPDGAAAQVAQLCGVGASTNKATLVLLDIPDDGGYYKMEADVSEASLECFVEDPGDRQQLSN